MFGKSKLLIYPNQKTSNMTIPIESVQCTVSNLFDKTISVCDTPRSGRPALALFVLKYNKLKL